MLFSSLEKSISSSDVTTYVLDLSFKLTGEAGEGVTRESFITGELAVTLEKIVKLSLSRSFLLKQLKFGE